MTAPCACLHSDAHECYDLRYPPRYCDMEPDPWDDAAFLAGSREACMCSCHDENDSLDYDYEVRP